MIIGVISDTHDRLPVIEVALNIFTAEGVQLVVHVGDWKAIATAIYFANQAASRSLPVRGVLGNNDADVAAFISFAVTAPGDFELYEGPWTMTLEGGRKLTAYHGHHRPTLARLQADPANTVLCLGHTHKPRIERDGGRLIVNPGSTAFAIPRRTSWAPTVAVIDTDRLSAKIIEVA